MRAAVLCYRVMAYITGVLIIVVCFVGIPLQVAGNSWIVKYVGTLHGYLYMVYVVVAFILAVKLRMRARPTVLLLLAGTIPILTFFVERWMRRVYIGPALAADTAQATQQPVRR